MQAEFADPKISIRTTLKKKVLKNQVSLEYIYDFFLKKK